MFLRFLLIGGTGYLIDAGATQLLIIAGVASWLARIPAIILAMIYTWFLNRTFTYRVQCRESLSEAYRYATVASAMALMNYMIYLILISFNVLPYLAITIATALQAILSYILYKHLVFTADKKRM